MTGTASHVRSFLLLEVPGPWGRDALRDSRMTPALRDLARRASAAEVRVLLVRRPGRSSGGGPSRVIAAHAAGPRSWLEEDEAAPDAAPDVDVEGLRAGHGAGLARREGDLFLVCTHGRHDACCAERGRPAAAALAARFPEETYEVSHIGGDRFAANLLVLPEGLYYGRVSAGAAPEVAEAHRRGELVLGLLRGRTTEPFPVQAAEIELRRHLGLSGRHDVRVTRRSRRALSTTVDFRTTQGSYRVTLESGQYDAARLTCLAERDSLAPWHRLVALEPLEEAPQGDATG